MAKKFNVRWVVTSVLDSNVETVTADDAESARAIALKRIHEKADVDVNGSDCLIVGGAYESS